MVASTLQQPRREWFDILDDWFQTAKRDRFVFVGPVWTTSFSHCLSCNWGLPLVLLSLRRGTPTGWRLVILRALIFLQRLCQRLLTLWVILFFYFGVLKLRAISSGGSNLGDSGSFCGAPRSLCSHWFHASTV